MPERRYSKVTSAGWSKGDWMMRIVTNPVTGRIDFIATRDLKQKLPREVQGPKRTRWECVCGKRRPIVKWKNSRGRRLYSLSDLEWAKKHEKCRARRG